MLVDRRKFLKGAGGSLAAVSMLDLAFLDRIAQAGNATSHFSRMFPGLPTFGAGLDPNAVVADIMAITSPGNPNAPKAGANAPMVEPGGVDDTLFGAWFTYWGQGFICHDISFDQVPQPTANVKVETIPDHESVHLDLSQVYGSGQTGSPELYRGDKFNLTVNANGVLDMHRNPDGSAIVADPRQDENFITASMQVALRAFHNAIVDLGMPFVPAQKLARQYAQFITLHEFLPQLCGPDVIAGLLNGTIPRFYKPGNNGHPDIPVEWSVAAGRLHPMVRNAYAVQLTTNGKQSFPNNRQNLFNGLGGNNGVGDLHGGRPLFETIDWGNFVNELARGNFNPSNGTDSFMQFYKQIIPQMAASLFLLPIGQTGGLAVPQGSINLAFRDLIRSFFYQMPTGQAVAAQYGLDVIAPSDVLTKYMPQPVDPDTVPSFKTGTPLWLYILAESYKNGYTKDAEPDDDPGSALPFAAYAQPNAQGTYGPDQIGDTGARIYADFILRLLEIDPHGLLHSGNSFTPQTPIAATAGEFGFGDLCVFAGVAVRP